MMHPSVAIIGAGYVGLPLAIRFAQKGRPVCAIDKDSDKVAALNQCRSYINEITPEEIAKVVNKGMLWATSDFSSIQNAEAIIVCVPTPLTVNRDPDLHFVLETAHAIGQNLQKGQLVSLESTTYPGTTTGEFREALEKSSSLRAGVDFHLAFSPEREDPGNPNSRVNRVPKIVGGLTNACRDKAAKIYSDIAGDIVPVESCEVAEAAKLLENIFRSVNIALVNELKMIYDPMGIDIWEVIKAASTKPFGFMPFYPGPGLGGHCIPIDPFYLTWKAREFGKSTRFIELSGEINRAMPQFVLEKIQDVLNDKGKAVRDSRILILGLAYKPDVNDCRESPSFELMKLLRNRGAKVSYYDPYVPKVPATRNNPDWTGLESVDWNEDQVRSSDLSVIITDHRNVNYEELLAWAPHIVDTRNVLPYSEKVTKA